MTKKEFDRGVCFTFFSDWERQAERIAGMYGVDVGYKYLMGIIKYALYEEEPYDETIQLLLEGLKGQINSSQNRRARGFNRENLEQTQKIIEYYEEHPEISQDNIAKTLGVSKGKVNKVLQNHNRSQSRSTQSVSESLSISLSESKEDVTDAIFDLRKHPNITHLINNN